MAGCLNDPEWARVLPALLMLKTPRVRHRGDSNDRLEHEQEMALNTLLDPGRRGGRAAAPTSTPQEAVTMLVGPLLFAHLTDSVKLDKSFVDRAVDNFLNAYAPC